MAEQQGKQEVTEAKQPSEVQYVEAMLGTIENQFKKMSEAILLRSMLDKGQIKVTFLIIF